MQRGYILKTPPRKLSRMASAVRQRPIIDERHLQLTLLHLEASIVYWWRWRKERELALFIIWQLYQAPQCWYRWRQMCGSTSRGWWLQQQRELKR
jgi:hypothetical protein